MAKKGGIVFFLSILVVLSAAITIQFPANPIPRSSVKTEIVVEGKQQDFEEKFAAVIEALNAAEGHENSTLWKDVSDGASYLITSEWTEEAAFSEFIRSEAFRNVTNWGKEQILSGRPQHKIYKS